MLAEPASTPGQAVLAADGGAGQVGPPKPARGRKLHNEGVPDARHRATGFLTVTAGFCFCFDLIIFMAWFFPFGINMKLIFSFTGSQS